MNELIKLPPMDFLNACFSYDETEGILTWKARPQEHFKTGYGWRRFNRITASREAGIKTFRPNGQRAGIRVKFQYLGERIFPSVHRILFAMRDVVVPDGCIIDHRDGDPFNNRWDNLRVGTIPQNMFNSKKIFLKRDLPKGVHLKKNGRYRTYCQTHGKSKYLGTYDTPEQAHAAYCAHAEIAHGEFHRAS